MICGSGADCRLIIKMRENEECRGALKPHQLSYSMDGETRTGSSCTIVCAKEFLVSFTNRISQPGICGPGAVYA
jgi:hypothetical protein